MKPFSEPIPNRDSEVLERKNLDQNNPYVYPRNNDAEIWRSIACR